MAVAKEKVENIVAVEQPENLTENASTENVSTEESSNDALKQLVKLIEEEGISFGVESNGRIVNKAGQKVGRSNVKTVLEYLEKGQGRKSPGTAALFENLKDNEKSKPLLEAINRPSLIPKPKKSIKKPKELEDNGRLSLIPKSKKIKVLKSTKDVKETTPPVKKTIVKKSAVPKSKVVKATNFKPRDWVY